MILITREIIGPGIEEEYADALLRINKLFEILKPFPEDNSTPEGRLKLELAWLTQEIEDRHISFPVDRRYISTFLYVIAEGMLDTLQGFPEVAAELHTILLHGLVKRRHYPVVAAMIADALSLVPQSAKTPEVQAALNDLEKIKTGLLEESISLPLRRENWPAIAQIRWTKRPDMPFPIIQAMFAIYFTLFTGGRPDVCAKGPLPAPRPGLRSDGTRARR